MLTCPSCGAAVESTWRHCGSCGAALGGGVESLSEAEPSTTDEAATEPVRRPPGPWWQRPIALAGVLVLVLALASVAMVGAEVRLGHRTHDLRAAKASLKDARSLLGTMRTELADTVKSRDALRTDLDKTKGSLSDAQRSVESQNQQLQTLKECLNAIEDVGNALDRGDDKAAREAIDRADSACSQAEAFL